MSEYYLVLDLRLYQTPDFGPFWGVFDVRGPDTMYSYAEVVEGWVTGRLDEVALYLG